MLDIEYARVDDVAINGSNRKPSYTVISSIQDSSEGNKENDSTCTFAIKLSFSANIILFIAKTFALILTGSLAVLASVVDSLLDLLSQAVLWWTHETTTQKHSFTLEYPTGRSRLGPLGIIICAAWMGMAALEVIQESVTTLWKHSKSNASFPDLEIDTYSMTVLICAVCSKIFLYLYCARVARIHQSSSVEAVALDHFNDVLSNCVAVLAAFTAHFDQKRFWWVDPVGAIGISIYIVWSWFNAAQEQTEKLAGKSADTSVLAKLRDIADRHHPDMTVDILRAYHFGPRFLVELEVVLPETCTLKVSHDIGMELQHKMEAFDLVERAFVHIDYQPRSYDEHDKSSWPTEYMIKVKGLTKEVKKSAI